MAKTEVRANQIKDELTDTDFAAANKDGAAATPCLRTLGTGAAQSCAGNDSRLSDPRTPTGTAGGVLAGTYPNPSFEGTKSSSASSIGHRLSAISTNPTYDPNTTFSTIYYVPWGPSDLPLWDSTNSVERIFKDVPAVAFEIGTGLTAGRPYDLFLFLAYATPSIVNTSTDVLTLSADVGWVSGTWVRVVTTGGGLTAGTDYWWHKATATTGSFHVSASDALSGGNKVDLTGLPADATLAGLTIEKLVWTSSAARATSVTYQGRADRKTGDKSRLYIGAFVAVSSTAAEDSVINRYLINRYNRIKKRVYVCPGYSNDNATTTYLTSGTSTNWVNATTLAGSGTNPSWLNIEDDPGGQLPFFSFSCVGTGAVNSNVAIGLGFDTATDAEVAGFAAQTNVSGGHSLQQERSFTVGVHTAYAQIRADTTTSRATVFADLARLGAAADPAMTYLVGDVWG